MNILKQGSRGNDVFVLQKALDIPQDGVFGKKTKEAVIEFQKANNLLADGIVGNKTWELLLTKLNSDSTSKEMGNGVVYNPINVNIKDRKGSLAKYLVIHYTAGASSANDSELKTRLIFLKSTSSADFIVDDDTMLQVNPDPSKFYCFAVGDAKGKYGIYNKDCISIEICSNLKKGTTAKVPNHDGWYFTEESVNNALILAKMIMEKYNISIDNVIRHYDVSRKLCPGIIGWNPGTIYDSKTGKASKKKSTEEKWIEFKTKLSNM